MVPRSIFRKRSHGFGLVEIMVGIAIGLIGVLVIMQVGAVFEGQKRTTTSGADTQTNGSIALYMMERDLRRAGYGLNVASALGCAVRRKHDDQTATPDLELTPIKITDGASGLPDKIQFLASSKGGFSMPGKITKDHPPQATNVFLNTVLGVEEQDMIILHEPGKNCTLFQVTGIPNGTVQVHHQNSGSKWNPPSGGDIYPSDGFDIGASAINMGAIIDRTYYLDDSGSSVNLFVDDYSSSTNLTSPQPVAADIVQLQAQYGFDTRSGTQTDARVDRWSATMIDADNNTVTGDNGDLQRIYAVRVALVARSSLKEKPQEDGTCNITAEAPKWKNANPSPDPDNPVYDLDLDVSKNLDGSANPDWRCYRYRVFDTVIPLRNLLWRE